MKNFANANASDLRQAVSLSETARRSGRTPSFAGGGSDLLALVKDRIVMPDVLINLKTVKGLDQVSVARDGGFTIGGLTTLDAVSRHSALRRQLPVLAPLGDPAPFPDLSLAGRSALAGSPVVDARSGVRHRSLQRRPSLGGNGWS